MWRADVGNTVQFKCLDGDGDGGLGWAARNKPLAYETWCWMPGVESEFLVTII